MRRIVAQARKELTQIVRDWRTVALALALPVFLLVLMSNALSLTVNELPIVVQDFDGSTVGSVWETRFSCLGRYSRLERARDCSPLEAETR
jgi:ABC-2 type transport system permease protein